MVKHRRMPELGPSLLHGIQYAPFTDKNRKFRETESEKTEGHFVVETVELRGNK